MTVELLSAAFDFVDIHRWRLLPWGILEQTCAKGFERHPVSAHSVYEMRGIHAMNHGERATLLILTLEGSTAVSRIDKHSGALAYAQKNLDRFLEAEGGSRA